MQLSPESARVLGSLVEKGLATPQQYPLTINALQSACNQTSNREPVVDYDETTVLAALDALKDQKLVRFVLPSHGRSVVRYRQVLDETLGLDDPQCAILAVLLLRGPQTVGELRIRTERMARFDGLDEVAARTGPPGLARRAARPQRRPAARAEGGALGHVTARRAEPARRRPRGRSVRHLRPRAVTSSTPGVPTPAVPEAAPGATAMCAPRSPNSEERSRRSVASCKSSG